MAVDNRNHALIGGVLVGLGYFLQGRKGFNAEQDGRRMRAESYGAEKQLKLPLSFSTYNVNSAMCISANPHFGSGLCYDESNHKLDRTGNTRGSHGEYGYGEPSCIHCKRVWNKMSIEEKRAWKQAFVDWNNEYDKDISLSAESFGAETFNAESRFPRWNRPSEFSIHPELEHNYGSDYPDKFMLTLYYVWELGQHPSLTIYNNYGRDTKKLAIPDDKVQQFLLDIEVPHPYVFNDYKMGSYNRQEKHNQKIRLSLRERIVKKDWKHGAWKYANATEETWERIAQMMGFDKSVVVGDGNRKMMGVDFKIPATDYDRIWSDIVRMSRNKDQVFHSKLMERWNKELGDFRTSKLKDEFSGWHNEYPFYVGATTYRGESFASDMEVGNTIYRQLGGNRFRMMTGAKDMVWDGDSNSLQMKIGRNSLGANYLIITLNANDLYDMRFESRRWNRKTYDLNIKVKGEYNDLYADQLQSVFTEATGLYTRMAESFAADDTMVLDEIVAIIEEGWRNEWQRNQVYDMIVGILEHHGLWSAGDVESFDAESFSQWSQDELHEPSHKGRKMQFDDWLDGEIKSHGDIPLSEWGYEEEHDEPEHQHAETFNAEKRDGNRFRRA